MSNSLTASKKVMKNYLSELLTDSELVENNSIINNKIQNKPFALKANDENKSLESLLKKVSEPKEETTEVVAEKLISTEVSKVNSTVNITPLKSVEVPKKAYREGDFQAMYFDVAGLIVAVPLIELGGIHKVDKINSLMGKPDWFKGVMLYREEKINVVDTALWVMPEKCDQTLKNSLNYQYIIMLNDSSWGLMAENLIDTVILSQDEVKWLDSNGKRPWLAGLVKEKMCALLDVSSMIKLLDEGNGIHIEK